MDTSTGEIYLNEDEVREAIESGKNPKNFVQLPDGIAANLFNMNRKQRRQWYAKNKKQLALPRWSDFNS